MKNRLEHPIDFTNSMLNNWVDNPSIYLEVSNILKAIKSKDHDILELFAGKYSSDFENNGSAFHVYVKFVHDYLNKVVN